ncbi:MAG: ribulose-phosphate 3-epimerase [Eubacteriaceae bacterium]|nr:ribulose-phosphate 3-epimerase [Eubacteriaceae bacterium]
MKIKIAPSMLSADFANLESDLKKVEAAGADYLHVDIMDGHFVPNITMGPDQVKQLRRVTRIPFDVHLMISEPLLYIEKFVAAGADLITIHVESQGDTMEAIKLIKKGGIEAGIVISPDTDVSVIKPFLDHISMVLIMGVYPGFGGQSYIPETTQKIKTCRDLIGDRAIDIQVDGGINYTTIKEVVEAGATVVVSGSCLFNGDMKENIKKFESIIGDQVMWRRQ